MKWIKCSDGLPSNYIVNNYFVKQRMRGSDEDWFPGVCTYSRGHDSFSWEWEISEDYEVIEWLDENDNEIERNAEMINEINNSLNQEVQKWKDKHYTAMQRIVELESAFAGAEEMVKDKIKRISDIEKERDKLEAEICRLEMIWETERGDNNRLKKENERLKNSIL